MSAVASPDEGVTATFVGREQETKTHAGRKERPDDEALAPILRRRLRFVAGLSVFGFTIGLVQRIALAPAAGWPPLDQLLVVTCAAALALALPAFLLLSRRSAGLRTLRRLEAVVFGGLVAQAVAQTFAPIPDSAVLPEMGNTWTSALLLQWSLVIVLYGVLVPNTAWRAAVMIGLMVLLAAASLALSWARYGLPVTILVSWGSTALIYLGLTAAFAVFNSARLDSYRREAAVAREIGPYRLGRRLGGGAMGEVFAAEHRLLKRPCAVKLIRPDRAADDTTVKRFEREAAAAARLTHPAAVQVYDYGRTADGTFYYVMEYLPGFTLDELVWADGPIPPNRAVGLLRQVCGALAEAHDLGLIHRDVKPANVIVCDLAGRADAAKLLDFGLVMATGEADTRLTNAGSFVGTPTYMSPEQARGATDLTPVSDLYSLGATAYYLLTGRPPFTSSNMLELLHAHQAEPVEPPSAHAPGLPPALEAVVMRLLAKRPADRYQSADEVDAALAAAMVAASGDGG